MINRKLAKKVIFIPAGSPWQKNAVVNASATDRAKMVARVISKNESFELSTKEIERSGPTYTIDSVREFQQENPTEEYVLLLGSDAFNGIESWKEHKELLSLIDIVVAIRPGVELTNIPGAHVSVIESEMFAISSTEIREAVRTGADLHSFVPDEIVEDVKRIYGA